MQLSLDSVSYETSTPGVILRDYQREAVKSLLHDIFRGGHPVCGLPTGAGKGVVIAELCRRLPGRILVATHRKELLAQNDAQLQRLMGTEAQSGIYSAGMGRRDVEARVIFGGIQSIYRHMDALQAPGDFAYVIVDECFPAGTLIDGRPIETLGTGEYIRTWNHHKNMVEYKKINAISKRLAMDLLTITLSSGKIITCTENHPFWTGVEYVPARELVPGVSLYMVQYDSSGGIVDKKSEKGLETDRQDILLQGSWKTLCGDAFLNRTQSEQPNAQPRDTRQDGSNSPSHWASPKNPRREWPGIDDASTTLARHTAPWMDTRAHGDDICTARREGSRRDMVQDRYSSPWRQAGRRDRWPFSLCIASEGEGFQERSAPYELRMDRIASIKQACIEQSKGVPVYNLDVADNHNFFAEDILVHNCHMVPPCDVDSMYATVFGACPQAQRIGLTATPYRLDGGPIYGQQDSWFASLAVDIGVQELTAQGYLAPLVGIQAAKDIDLSKVRIRQGDYVLSDLSQVMSDEQRVRRAVNEIHSLAAERASWLCFCCDVAHTAMVTQEMQNRGILARMVIGSTPIEERDQAIEDFRRGKFRCLVNCQVATTGFDIPGIDCVILMRPTQSKGLLIQMLGRGTRLAPGKQDALILDYADTLSQHMPLEEIPEVRKTVRVEEQEQREQERREQGQREHARHQASVLDMYDRAAREYRVQNIIYKITASKARLGCHNLMVTYLCPDRPSKWLTVWICPEYHGYARLQAEAWFERRGSQCPGSAQEAMLLARRLPIPESIVVDERKNFPRIVMEHMEE